MLHYFMLCLKHLTPRHLLIDIENIGGERVAKNIINFRFGITKHGNFEIQIFLQL